MESDASTAEQILDDQIQSENTHLVVEIGGGRSQDAAVGLEHLSLDVDGEVAEAALLPLPVQAVQHGGLSAGEAHLHHRGVRAAASHLHQRPLRVWERSWHEPQR